MSSATAAEAWIQLRGRALEFRGARAFARVSTITSEGRRSFRFTMIVRADGSFDIDVLSPVGTRAAALSVRDRELVRRDTGEHHPIAELGRLIGLPLENREAREISMLLLGLPAHPTGSIEPAGSQRMVVRVDGIEYEVSERGLMQVRNGETTIWYDPPVFPPSRIRIASSSGHSFELEYLELTEM